MPTSEHLFSIALRRSALVGDMVFNKLVTALGSAEKVWHTPKSQLSRIDGIGTKIPADIGNPDHLIFAEHELRFCEENNIKILLRQQNELPYMLSECEDAPAILYQKGQSPDAKPLSIVGTRAITHYGRQFISELIAALPEACITVSGLALGADTEVHEKSIERQIPTIGVLAHGFHTFYPARNRKLSEIIVDRGGALLTEFNSSQKPDRENFIQRNRIVAGLSAATIIAETAFGGGSVSTATFANRYNRDVFALPGKITDKYSQGCNHLIYNNKATAVSTIADLINDLNFNENKGFTGSLFEKKEILPPLAGEKEQILSTIKQSPNINLDDLSGLLGVPTYQLLPILLEMEIAGYIRALSGRQFVAF